MRIPSTLLLFTAISVAAALTACSKSSTGPPGGGGGGGMELDSPNITASGGTWPHTFSTAGTFAYHCKIHSAMTGNSVTVSASSANDSMIVDINDNTSNGFVPKNTDVKNGGYVRWINNTSVAHTVTTGS